MHSLDQNIYAIDQATNLSTLFRKDVSTSFVSLFHYDGAVHIQIYFFIFITI